MKKRSLSQRAVMEHGLISNILPPLPLVDRVILANIHSRTYEITVPWNSGCVEIPKNAVSVFPKIDTIPDGFICKITETFIGGEKGEFYGPVDKLTNVATGEGVFKAKSGWVICGRV